MTANANATEESVLVAMAREWKALWESPSDHDYDRTDTLSDAISFTPAQDMADALAQVRVARFEICRMYPEEADEVTAEVIGRIERVLMSLDGLFAAAVPELAKELASQIYLRPADRFDVAAWFRETVAAGQRPLVATNEKIGWQIEYLGRDYEDADHALRSAALDNKPAVVAFLVRRGLSWDWVLDFDKSPARWQAIVDEMEVAK